MKWIHKNAIATIALSAFLTLTVMVVLQARVIEDQETLIHSLFSDSLELNARKVPDIQVNQAKRPKNGSGQALPAN